MSVALRQTVRIAVFKVLIVDDDVTIVKLLRTLLELDGFEVFSALRGGDVMTQANQCQPDIFLIDFHLTDMDGTEVVQRLRADATFAEKPIVVASGLDVEDEVIKAGATAFLVKPFEPSELPILFNQLISGA
ncbi:MAG: response regulator [Chloroflexota bacterium]|nr:response regulator [Chloroflexota bacterium]